MLATRVTLEEFVARVVPVLCRHESENNLMIGSARSLASGKRSAPRARFVALEEAGTVVGGALRLPPHSVLVSRVPHAALPRLVPHFDTAETPVTSVLGPGEVGRLLAAAFATVSGRQLRMRVAQRVLELTAVVPPATPSGFARRVEPEDRELLSRWIGDFNSQIDLPNLPEPPEWAQRLVTQPLALIWQDGEPRSLAAQVRDLPGGACISPVYTPPDARGRGYAKALVATLCQLILRSGKRTVCLFTDHHNPIANHVYESIGFRQLCRYDMWELVQAPAAVRI